MSYRPGLLASVSSILAAMTSAASALSGDATVNQRLTQLQGVLNANGHAGGATSSTPSPVLTLNTPSGVQSGASYTVTGTYTNDGASPTLTVHVDGTALGSLPTGSTVGSGAITLKMPGVSTGQHAIYVTDASGNQSNTVTFQVVAPASTGPFPLTFPGAAGTTPTGNSHMVSIGNSTLPKLDGNGGLVQIPQQTFGLFDTIGAQGDGLYTVYVQPGAYRYGQLFFRCSADQSNRYWLTFNSDGSGIGLEQSVNNAYTNKGRFLNYQTDPTAQPVTAAGGSIGFVINGNTITPVVDGALPVISGGSQSYTTDGAITAAGLIGLGIYDSGGKSVVYIKVDFTPLNQVPTSMGGTSTTATTIPGAPGAAGTPGSGSTGSGSTGSGGSTTTSAVADMVMANARFVPGSLASTLALEGGTGTVAVPLTGSFMVGGFYLCPAPPNSSTDYPLQLEMFTDSGHTQGRTGLVIAPTGNMTLNAGGVYGSQTSQPCDSAQHYLSFVYFAATGVVQAHLDGIVVAQQTYAGPPATGYLIVGTSANLKSRIEELVIYNGTNGVAQVAIGESAYVPPVGTTPANAVNLLAIYRMNGNGRQGDNTTADAAGQDITVPTTDGLAPGIYFPDTIYVHSGANAYPLCGNGFVRGLVAPPTITFNNLPTGVYQPPVAFAINPTGLQLEFDGSTLAVGSYQASVTVTDGVSTFNHPFTVVSAATCVEVSGNFILDTTANPAYGTVQVENVTGAVTLTDPANLVSLNANFLGCDLSKLTAHFGANNYTLNMNGPGGAITQPGKLFVGHEFPALSKVSPVTAYTSTPIGTAIATVQLYNDAGISNLSLIGSDGTLAVSIDAAMRVATIYTIAAQTSGNKSLALLVISGTGLPTSITVPYTVQQGTLLASSNVTTNFSTTLDNSMGTAISPGPVAIGTVTISGMTNPAVSVQVIGEDPLDLTGNRTTFQSRLTVAPTSNPNVFNVSAYALSAGSYPIQVTAIAGAVACVAGPIPLPVADVRGTGPTVSITPGGTDSASVAASYNEAFDLAWNSPAGYKGFTIAFPGGPYNSQFTSAGPNARAEFNRAQEGHGSNQSYGPGPVTLTGPSPTNPTRISFQGSPGLAYQCGISVENGDWTLNDIIFGDCSGGSNTPAVYLVGGQASSLTMNDCKVYNSDNGLLSGPTQLSKITLNRIAFAFCGTGDVGLTHNLYIGETGSVVASGILSFANAGGHTLKSRAIQTSWDQITVADGQNGAASNIIDFPVGGKNNVTNFTLHKGCSPQNPYIVEYCEDNQFAANDVNDTVFDGGVVLCTTPPGALSTPVVAFFHRTRYSLKDGRASTLTVKNTKFYNLPKDQWFKGTVYGNIIDGGGNTFLTEWPDLIATDPSTGQPITAALSPRGTFSTPWNPQAEGLFFGAIELQTRIAANAAAGTRVTQVFSSDGKGNALTGQTFTLPAGGLNAAGLFVIDPSSGVISVANGLPANALPDGLVWVTISVTGHDYAGNAKTYGRTGAVIVGTGYVPGYATAGGPVVFTGTQNLYGTSALPGMVIDINPQVPSGTGALVGGTPGIQVNGAGYVQNMIESGPNAFGIAKGYGTGSGGGGALMVAATDLAGSPMILRGTINNYDNLVFPAAAGDFFYANPGQPWMHTYVYKTTAQGGTAMFKGASNSGVNLSIDHFNVSSGAGLNVGQNNLNAATEPAGLPIGEWDVAHVGFDGTYYWAFRNGTLTAKSGSTTAGGNFGQNGLSVFEFMNGFPVDVARIIVSDQFPSMAQMQADLNHWVSVYGITTTMATITAGNSAATNVAPYVYDGAAAWLTTPNFPTANPPVVQSAGLTGLTLAAGATNVASWRFGGVPLSNVPDRATLDSFFYFNPINGNQSVVLGNDGIEGETSCYARVRRYPVTSQYDCHVLENDGLHMKAVGSKNNTVWGFGTTYGAILRVPINILPGMAAKVRFRSPTNALAWFSMWLFGGHQVSPNLVSGANGNPYFNYNNSGRLIQTTTYYYEKDINDNYARTDKGVAVGHQLDFGVVRVRGNGGANGDAQASPNEKVAPYTSYVANGGGFTYEANNGYPFAASDQDQTVGIHELVIDWPTNNTINYFLDGKLFATQYQEYYGDVLSTPMPDGTTQVGMHLLISNEAIPVFTPGFDPNNLQPQTVTDRESFTGVIEEISIFQGNVLNPTANAAPNGLTAPVPVQF